jgi:hypothetical protein
LTFLRLFSPANFVHSLSYLRKYGVRLCFARTVFILSMALGLRRAKATLTRQLPAHKVKPGWGPLKRRLPDGPPDLNGSRDVLRREIAAIKEGLADSVRQVRKMDD